MMTHDRVIMFKVFKLNDRRIYDIISIPILVICKLNYFSNLHQYDFF